MGTRLAILRTWHFTSGDHFIKLTMWHDTKFQYYYEDCVGNIEIILLDTHILISIYWYGSANRGVIIKYMHILSEINTDDYQLEVKPYLTFKLRYKAERSFWKYLLIFKFPYRRKKTGPILIRSLPCPPKYLVCPTFSLRNSWSIKV